MDFPQVQKKAKNEQEVIEAIALSDLVSMDEANEFVFRSDGAGVKDLKDCADFIDTWDSEISYMDKKSEQVTLQQTKIDCAFEKDDWRTEWHANYSKCTTEKSLVDMTDNFLQGMVWVLDYYMNGIRDWNWFYPYHYPPTLLDCFTFTPDHQFSFSFTSPVKPTIQLLSVLPPESSTHLPPSLQKVFSHPKLQSGYPKEFEIDHSGCTRAFQGKVLLPFLDRGLLEEVANEVDDRTEVERDRDKEGKTLVYLASTKIQVWEHGKKSFFSKRTMYFGLFVAAVIFTQRERIKNLL